jgi:hypothetical protein
MIIQVLLTDVPFSPYLEKDAAGQVVISDLAEPIGRTSYISSTLGPSLDLELEVNGEVVVQDSIQTSTVLDGESYPYFEEFDLSAGNHQLRLTLTDLATGTSFVYFDAPVVVSEGDILTIPPPSN